MCFVVLVFIIVAIVMLVGSSIFNYIMSGGFDTVAAVTIIGIVFLVMSGVMLTIIIIYYRAVLRVLGGIKKGLSGAPVFTLPSIGVFTVMICIMIGCTLLSTLFSAMLPPSYFEVMNSEILHDMPEVFLSIYGPLLENTGTTVMLSAITTFVTNIGSILCIVVLNRFNGKLKLSRPTLY